MIRRLLAPTLLAGAALAQDAVPNNRFVPASAQIVMRIKAPAVWHEQFANTRLGKVFAGPTLAPIRKQARENYPEALDKAAATGMPREVLQALIEDYRGELIVSMQVDIDAVAANQEAARTPFAVMIALAPDGKFDLAALQAGLRKVDEKREGRASTLQIGDHTFRVADGRTPATQAELVDGHLVMFVGTALEKLAPGMLARTNRGERLPANAPFAVHVDLGGVIDAIVAAANEHMRPAELAAPPKVILETLGMLGLDAFDLSLGTAGERVAIETSLTARGDSLGIFAGLFANAKRPALLRYVPPSVASFSVTSFDFQAVVRAVMACLELGGGKEASAQMEAGFREKTKVRLREDLLDHLGGGLMLLGDLRGLVTQLIESRRDGARPDPNRVLADFCLGVALRDGKAFAASIDTMLRATGLHAARKTEEYRGVSIHELRLGGAITIEYAITDDLALVVLGSRGNGSDFLRASIDTKSDGKDALPESVAKRLEGVPDGWNGVSTTPLVDLALLSVDAAFLQAPQLETVAREAKDMITAIAKELKALGLDYLVSVSYSSPKSVRTIYRW